MLTSLRSFRFQLLCAQINVWMRIYYIELRHWKVNQSKMHRCSDLVVVCVVFSSFHIILSSFDTLKQTHWYMHCPLRIAMQQLFNNNNNNNSNSRARAHSHEKTIKLAHTQLHTNTLSVTFLGLRLGQRIKRNEARTAQKKVN